MLFVWVPTIYFVFSDYLEPPQKQVESDGWKARKITNTRYVVEYADTQNKKAFEKNLLMAAWFAKSKDYKYFRVVSVTNPNERLLDTLDKKDLSVEIIELKNDYKYGDFKAVEIAQTFWMGDRYEN